VADWVSAVDPRLVASVGRFRGYDGASASDLLRFIRNLDQHFTDQTDQGLLVLRDSLLAAAKASNTGGGDSGSSGSGTIPSSSSSCASSWRDVVGTSTVLQQEAIEAYFCSELFPGLVVALWEAVGTDF